MNPFSGLATELAAEFPGVPVLADPVDNIPATPAIVLVPGTPLAAPSQVCDVEWSVQVMHVHGRTNERGVVAAACGALDGIRDATNRAGGAWQEANLTPVEVGGVDYLAMIHDVIQYQ